MKRKYIPRKNLATLVAIFLGIATLVAMAGLADAYTVQRAWERIGVTAGETLTTGQVVMIKDSDGYAYKADADNDSLRPAIGIVGMGASSGSSVEIITRGIVSGWTGLAEGGPAYLSTTAGAVTQTSPTGAQQQIGTAISTTQYLFDFQPPTNSYFTVALHHEGPETATLDPAAVFQMPFAATLVEVSAVAGSLDQVDTDETYTVDLEEAGTSVLSSAITLATANTPVVGTVSDSAIADNAKMEVVLTLGGTTPSAGDVTVLLTFKKEATD